MSPQRMYTAGERPHHKPGDCRECGEQQEVASWSLDTRLGAKEERWLPNEVCTNPDCTRGRQHGAR